MKNNTLLLQVAVLCLLCHLGCTEKVKQERYEDNSIPFAAFADFERVENANPLFKSAPPNWSAAAHAILVEDTIHYYWSMRSEDKFWDLHHAVAPTSDPTLLVHDERNPIMTPPPTGMDSKSIEYPCPFYNPADGKHYMYYLVKAKDSTGFSPKQTGLLVSHGDMGVWEKVSNEPVIHSEFEHEKIVAGHTSVAIVGDTIHIIYTSLISYEHNPTICHATAPLSNPALVTKNPNNPVFKGSGEAWDAKGVREAEVYQGPVYFHIFYGGRNKDGVFQIGHVRTKDFSDFEPNPHNPILKVATDKDAWDSAGLLTPQVFEVGDYYYMLYAGLEGDDWDKGHCLSGLARAPK